METFKKMEKHEKSKLFKMGRLKKAGEVENLFPLSNPAQCGK